MASAEVVVEVHDLHVGGHKGEMHGSLLLLRGENPATHTNHQGKVKEIWSEMSDPQVVQQLGAFPLANTAGDR
jgi:hypothetical protein